MLAKRDTFDKRLRSVRARCDANVLLEQLGRVLGIAGLVLAVGVLFERTTSIGVIHPLAAWVSAGAVVAATGVLWFLRRPTAMQAALLIDGRLGLHERFSTALALAKRDDPFGRAAVTEAHQAAEHLSTKRHFPLRPSRRWAYAAVAWAAVLGMFFFLPEMDLLGRDKKHAAEQDKTQQLAQAKVHVQEATSLVKMAVNQLGDANLKEQLAALGNMPEGAKPEQIRRQAIRKLGNLSDRIKKLQADKGMDSARMLKTMLARLRGQKGQFSRKLNRALAKGDFARARDLIRQLEKESDDGKLSPQQRKDLENQLADLGRRLQELARQNRELEKELAKAGLDETLAKLTQEMLRKALERQGLSERKIQELLDKAGACRRACRTCSRLGEAMACCGGGGGAGGLSGGELDKLAEQLDALEALKQDLAMTEASMCEIARAIDGLGQCEGMLGCQGPYREGLSMRRGKGTGGPGRGFGPRETGGQEDTSTFKTRVKNKPNQGPIIASWYFQGSHVKGESRRELTDIVQAAKDRASEAVTDNRIPRKYEKTVKKYFGELTEQTRE